MSLWLVQDRPIAGEMTASAEVGDGAAGSCDGDDGDAGSGACLAMCATATQIIIPGELPAAPSASAVGFEAPLFSRKGRSNSPDHGPPKPLAFG